ncbi:tail fiber domain-containing protein [Winogradskyella eximia]|uniref:tail fiber domain-containing protein n=1 Tax=Winogradskyella eximia TaxID=262006 RepID=UPI002492ADD6|nr:tail fiber domain-containing protein [Winogradskyella eximia]
MKKITITLTFILFSFLINAQVGIGNTDPKAQLDISAGSTTSEKDGILIPRLTEFPTGVNADQDGMLVFLTGAGTPEKGFYYYDNNTSSWLALTNASGGTLDDAYDFGGAGNGNEIIASDGAVTITGTDGFFVSGNHGAGEIAPNIVGSQMYFNPRKSAFRAGGSIAGNWMDNVIGNYSFAGGFESLASGDYSTAFGNLNSASGTNSIALGLNTDAIGENSTAMGSFTDADGVNSTAMGSLTDADGLNSTAMGRRSLASGENSIATGWLTYATGLNSTAFGSETQAIGENSIASGNSSYASGDSSTAFGASTASGNWSTAMGSGTVASGRTSIAMGNSTNASSFAETTIGSYSTNYTPISTELFDNDDRLFSLGNGTNEANRSNALTIYKSGLMNINDEYNMPLTAGTNGQVMTTDGSGNVTFQNPNAGTDNQIIDNLNLNGTTLELSLEDDGVADETVDLSSLKDADWYQFGTTENSNDILDNIYTEGKVQIGGPSIPIPAHGGALNIPLNGNAVGPGIRITHTGNISTNETGILMRFDGNNATYSVMENYIDGNLAKSGIYNDFGGTSDLSITGFSNKFNTTGDNNTLGLINTFSNNSTGDHTGVFNNFPGSSGGVANIIYGIRNNFFKDSNNEQYGMYNFSNNNSNVDKYGSYTRFSATSGGIHYGVYADVQKNNSYAAYFIGKTELGESSTNRYLMPGADGINGQVMTTDGNGTISFQFVSFDDNQNLTTPTLTGTTLNLGIQNGTGTSIDLAALQDGSGGTLDQAYDFGGPGNGNTINATDGAVTIAGEDGFLVSGTLDMGDDVTVTGMGSRMFFNPRNAVFRAGQVSDSRWDPVNNGKNSIAMGNNPTASGENAIAIGLIASASGTSSIAIGNINQSSGFGSVAIGVNNMATENYASAIGQTNTASGTNATAIGILNNVSGNRAVGLGSGNTVSGSVAVALGISNNATGVYALATGNQNTAASYAETAIGTLGTLYTPNAATSWDANDRIFSIGNGSSPTFRSNALTIYKSGLINFNDEYNMPLLDGINGQVMTTDGSGNVTFQNTTDGDITQITAGAGLTGGGITGALTVNAAANNGLTVNTGADRIQLGGSLIQDTEFTFGTRDIRWNLNDTGDFKIQDNGVDHWEINNAGDEVVGGGTYWRQDDTSGTLTARLTSTGDDATLDLRSNNATTTRIRANGDSFFNGGKLGIGDATPAGYLDILATNSGSAPHINLVEDSGSGARINFTNTATTNGNVWTLFGDTDNVTNNNEFNIFHTQLGNVIRLEGDGDIELSGKVGINKNEPITEFTVEHSNDNGNLSGLRIENTGANGSYNTFFTSNGTGNLLLYSRVQGATSIGSFNDTSGIYTATSDRRLKKDFKDLYFNWQSFMNLETLTYSYKKDLGNTKHIGLVAQDVQKIYPELINYVAEDDVYQMDYSATGVIAIKAVQELKQEVDLLKEENTKLKNQLSKYEALERRLSALENNKNTDLNIEASNISEEK